MRALPAFALAACTLAAGAQDPARFELQKIADGVYAAIRTEPPGLFLDANSVFIIGPDDVIVVDTNLTPGSAQATLAAMRKVTPLPVSAVINTHWHDDHVLGNQTYRDAFPKAQFVGHVTNEMLSASANSRRQRLQLGPQMVQQLRMSLEQSKSMGGGTLTAEERRGYEIDVASAERLFKEAPGVTPVTPTVTVADRTTFKQGARTIDVLHLGAAHSAADLVVHLPRERVLIPGDLVAAPVPIVGASSRPSAFAAALDKLIALKPAVIVPGHGPVMRDDSYAQRQKRLLESLVSQVRAAAATGAALADVRRQVNLDAFRKEFAGSSQLLGFLFDFQVTSPGVSAALREIRPQGTQGPRPH